MNRIEVRIFGLSLSADGRIAVLLAGLIALVVLLHLWMSVLASLAAGD